MTLVYNARNHLTRINAGTAHSLYSYDANGNQTKVVECAGDGGTTVTATREFGYDALNRMVSSTGQSGAETFAYRGAEWHRASLSAAGQPAVSFLYDGDNVAADIVGGGVETQYVTPFLDQNLSMTKASNTYYYTQDGLGSVRTLGDSVGQLVNKYDYSAFGEVWAAGTSEGVKQRYTYTGREASAVGGAMYYRYRMYDSAVGRFESRDPIGEIGSLDANYYEHVGDRPTVNSDPMGLWMSAPPQLGVTRGHPDLTFDGLHSIRPLVSRLWSAYAREMVKGNADTDGTYYLDKWVTQGFTDSEAEKHYMLGSDSYEALGRWRGTEELRGARIAAAQRSEARIRRFISDAKDNWSEAMKMPNDATRRGRCKLGWWLLGTALHTLQDRYSHTDGSYLPLSNGEHGGTLTGSDLKYLGLFGVAVELLERWKKADDPSKNAARYAQALAHTTQTLTNVYSYADGPRDCNCIDF